MTTSTSLTANPLAFQHLQDLAGAFVSSNTTCETRRSHQRDALPNFRDLYNIISSYFPDEPDLSNVAVLFIPRSQRQTFGEGVMRSPTLPMSLRSSWPMLPQQDRRGPSSIFRDPGAPISRDSPFRALNSQQTCSFGSQILRPRPRPRARRLDQSDIQGCTENET